MMATQPIYKAQQHHTLRRQRTAATSAPTPQEPVHSVTARLQRTIGNQRVGQLVGHMAIQTKLTLGPVGDPYEQEADAVAKQVLQQMDAPAATAATPAQAAQRQAAPGQEEEEPLAAKRLSIALQRAGALEEEEKVAPKRLPEAIQRQGAPEEEEMPLQAAIIRRSATVEGGPVSSEIESAIQRERGNGRPLAEGVRGAMEHSFGANFGGVNVHTGREADTLNQQLQARAFTTGKDIFFRLGEYNPESRGGQELLAHELTHVVQQTGRG